MLVLVLLETSGPQVCVYVYLSVGLDRETKKKKFRRMLFYTYFHTAQILYTGIPVSPGTGYLQGIFKS